jgi:hypothetical protein
MIRNQQVGGSSPLAGSTDFSHMKQIIQLDTGDPGKVVLYVRLSDFKAFLASNTSQTRHLGGARFGSILEL